MGSLSADTSLVYFQAEQEEILRSITPTQKGLDLRDYRKMKYLSQVKPLHLIYFRMETILGLKFHTKNKNNLKVIDETLRFVNISFVSFREATKDVSVNGALQKPYES